MPTPAALPIVCMPDPRLRARARSVHLPDPGVDDVIEQLLSAMRQARGFGLAAPQLGLDLRVAVVEVEGTQLVLLNPQVVERRGTQRGWEGCLSVPNMVAQVDRPAELTVAAHDRKGRGVRHRCSGLLARAVAHEVDHLAGRLYVDLVPPDSLVDVREHPTPPGEPPNPKATAVMSTEGPQR
jgi:peptide deformylase